MDIVCEDKFEEQELRVAAFILAESRAAESSAVNTTECVECALL